MATQLMYSFRDIKLGYMLPWAQPNDDCAIRVAKLAIRDPQSDYIYRYRTDLELWRVGQWDDRTGEIEADKKLLLDSQQLNAAAAPVGAAKKEENDGEDNGILLL